ncbi:MAG: TMEM198/TM7SF3 family protein [Vicinamibacterales bacterium]|jgi:hypothetical protein|nr:TMEM198/TM7SF3 family protein [Vicinamibacterales bacterium]
MLPLSAQVPASIVLLAGGAMACFAGYRLFRLVLGVYGFILGALLASSMAGASGTWMVVAAAIAGGAVGALVLFAGYFVGVALVGAGFGALAVNVAWKPFGGEPHWAAVLVAAALCAVVAMQFQRYVIIMATAFGGAWTMLIGAAGLMSGPGARAASAASDVFVVYPTYTGPNGMWVYVAWVAIALTGTYVQLHTAGGAKATTRARARKR